MLNKFFIISIDTECDKDKNWKVVKPLSFIGVYEGVNILEKIFDKFNIRAVYLLSPEVIYDEKSVLIFKDLLKKVLSLEHIYMESLLSQIKEKILNMLMNIQVIMNMNMKLNLKN